MNYPEIAAKRKISFGATLKAVFWAFIGIRKKIDYQKDAEQLNPVHIVIAGIIGAFVFIGALILIVKTIVAK